MDLDGPQAKRCAAGIYKNIFSGPMIDLTGKPTGKFRKTYCLQPKQFAMWQTLIAMQAQTSARACFSATKVGRQAAVPPFHILLVLSQLHFFFSVHLCEGSDIFCYLHRSVRFLADLHFASL